MSRRRLRCLLGHSWSYLVAPTGPIKIAAWCERCVTADMFPTTRLDKPPTSKPTSLAAAYDLVAAIAADDITTANQALRNTSAVQVAVVAIVLAKAPPISDLHRRLQLLALQAEIDAIDITDEGCAP
jgi:hypothetical protein